MKDKIMDGEALADTMDCLINCCSVLVAVRLALDESAVLQHGAIAGAADLLEAICKDFQAEIDAADDAPCIMDACESIPPGQ